VKKKPPINYGSFNKAKVKRTSSEYSVNASESSGTSSPLLLSAEHQVPAIFGDDLEINEEEANEGEKHALLAPRNARSIEPMLLNPASVPDTIDELLSILELSDDFDDQSPTFKNLTYNLVNQYCTRENIKNGTYALLLAVILTFISIPNAEENYDCNFGVVNGNAEHGPLLGIIFPWAEWLVTKVLHVTMINAQLRLALALTAGISSATTNVLTTIRAWVNTLWYGQGKQMFNTMDYGSTFAKRAAKFTFASACIAAFGSGVSQASDVKGDEAQVVKDLIFQLIINGGPFSLFAAKVLQRILMENGLADADSLFEVAEFQIPALPLEEINKLFFETSLDALHESLRKELRAKSIEDGRGGYSIAEKIILEAVTQLSAALAAGNNSSKQIYQAVIDFSKAVSLIEVQPTISRAIKPSKDSAWLDFDNASVSSSSSLSSDNGSNSLDGEKLIDSEVPEAQIKRAATDSIDGEAGEDIVEDEVPEARLPISTARKRAADLMISAQAALEAGLGAEAAHLTHRRNRAHDYQDEVEVLAENPSNIITHLNAVIEDDEDDASSSASNISVREELLKHPPQESANDEINSEHLTALQELIAQTHAFSNEYSKPDCSSDKLLVSLNKINQILKDSALISSNESFANNEADYLLEGNICTDNFDKFYEEIKRRNTAKKT
jgi:hypothetical protein